MWEDKETTAPIPSVAPDGEQPSAFARTVSITEIEETRKQFGKIQIMTMPELMETRFRVRPAVIDGLLPVGTYLLAGAPKIGKSFLVLQMAYQVSMGAPFLGFSSRQGTVLYLALEDTCERLQKRLAQMTEQDSEHLILSVFSETLNEGLTERLSDFWSEHTDTVLIIIDTLQRVRSRTPDGGSYAADYDTLARLKEFSDTAPDGTVLDQDYYAFDRIVSATSRDGVEMDTYGIGWEVLPSSTEDETGRHATILMTIHSLKGEFNFIGAKVKLTLNGLYRDNCLEELVVPGRWSCTFTMPETDPGRLCTVNEPIEIEGKNAVLTTLYISPLSLTCEIKKGTDDLKETVEPIYSDDGKESIAPEVTLQSGETIGAADWLFLITNYADKRGRYCFQMDEILDPETVSSVSAFGETFSVE